MRAASLAASVVAAAAATLARLSGAAPDADAHSENSPMKDVEVLGMDPNYHPATYPECDTPAVAIPATVVQALSPALQHASPVLMTARRGQLAGVVYFGNPNTAAGDPSTVGVAGGGAGGMLGRLPFNTRTAAATPNRVNYCLPLDGVCDLSPQTLRASQPTGGNHGRYFLAPSEWDNQVSDSFGRFVDRVRSG
ncbi:hypothetical protein [uncultured Corynebacterium sp.]|uniref:hypothetical protein n=1 Tax=uncultured Corynebacterium sp. TaxID=159447 RepID=UPI00259371BD|nr:hypothetical protein [uncultured Corynebacterium sp.]